MVRRLGSLAAVVVVGFYAASDASLARGRLALSVALWPWRAEPALLATGEGDDPTARALLDGALAYHPNSFRLRYNRGWLETGCGAARWYRQASQRAPLWPDPHINRLQERCPEALELPPETLPPDSIFAPTDGDMAVIRAFYPTEFSEQWGEVIVVQARPTTTTGDPAGPWHRGRYRLGGAVPWEDPAAGFRVERHPKGPLYFRATAGTPWEIVVREDGADPMTTP